MWGKKEKLKRKKPADSTSARDNGIAARRLQKTRRAPSRGAPGGGSTRGVGRARGHVCWCVLISAKSPLDTRADHVGLLTSGLAVVTPAPVLKLNRL